MPTTEMVHAGDVVMSVLQQSQHKPGGGNTRNSQQTRVVFCYVIVLCSRRTEEIWTCDMTSSCPDEVVVVNIN